MLAYSEPLLSKRCLRFTIALHLRKIPLRQSSQLPITEIGTIDY